MTVEKFLELLKTKYSWPGAYPIYFIASDGGCICHTCATEEKDTITEAITDNDRHSGWLVNAYEVNYESFLLCEHCGNEIEAAYDVVDRPEATEEVTTDDTYRYYFYNVDVPADCAETAEERADIAIREAREMETTYNTPATWSIVSDNGSIIRVCKTVNK